MVALPAGVITRGLWAAPFSRASGAAVLSQACKSRVSEVPRPGPDELAN